MDNYNRNRYSEVSAGESQNYYELQIKINPEIEDIVSGICFEYFDCEGVVLSEETYKDLEMIDTTEGTLKVFCVTEPDAKVVLSEQREILKSRGLTDEELGSWEFSISSKKNEDWSRKWKEKWDITRVTDKIVVVPDWLEYVDKQGEVVIRLEPGCAFGTGTHQTTQLCMKAIEKYMPCGAKMADIGTGSGILAICAEKFGAVNVYGCDNDSTVIDVAIENAFKNNAHCIFELNTADNVREKYDFICANILHNVLAEIMGDLKQLMKKDAILVLSGILDEKKSVVIEAVKNHGLNIIDEMHQNQWTAFVVKGDK